ncbi:hypothetical protein PSP6_560006 [Paraburkholderia tropica]|nr:hypothetical protein PSP6_560006 [Paraburkholderia tropica]
MTSRHAPDVHSGPSPARLQASAGTARQRTPEPGAPHVATLTCRDFHEPQMRHRRLA